MGQRCRFIGKTLALAERQKGTKRILEVFAVDTDDADLIEYEPFWIDGKVKGFCISGR